MTALRVAVPNTPLTVSPALRFAFSWRWTTLTASPVLPRPSETMSLSHVASPTTPLAVSPCVVWNVVTAAWVVAPNTPSIDTATPRATRNPWIARTSAPRLPRLWFGNPRREGGDARRRRGEQEQREDDRNEAAGRMRHGRKPSGAGSCGRGSRSVRQGGSAPGRRQVAEATVIAAVTASRKASAFDSS